MVESIRVPALRRKAVWGPCRPLAALLVALIGWTAPALAAGPHDRSVATARPGEPGRKALHPKLDNELSFRADRRSPAEKTSVIVTLMPGANLPAEFKKFAHAGKLGIINGHVVDLPNGLLKKLAAHPDIFDVHYNRPIYKHNFRTSLTVGGLAAQRAFGYTGAGVGVAVIDSGVASWHDDLTSAAGLIGPYGNQRVAAFVDFVNGQLLPYDDNGHGTHIAGTIAGNGFDSNGTKAGIAPEATLVSLKVLDANGQGTIANIIAALDWIVANRAAYNIRVANLSVGAGIHESYWTDPLTLAAKRAVDAGVVVVAAAGNLGRNALGQTQYGGITAPGNAPWVLTVGAYSTNGTPKRGDDVIAPYSSRGPSYQDYSAKPDLVAPGTGTVSLAAPGSLFYQTKALALVAGSVATAAVPYLSLSGTSMAAPVVAGTVALMLQANPLLTPNGVKAILQYTAQWHSDLNALTQGAGFLNTVGAVRLARFYATAQPGDHVPVQKMWSRHIIWGNHLLGRGVLNVKANAYTLGVNWGAARDAAGTDIVWGSACPDSDPNCDNIVWGSSCPADNPTCDNIVWGSSCPADNPTCDNIVWGSAAASWNIVWGSDCTQQDCDNIVWGSSCPPDNPTCDNIVWGSALPTDNVLWASSCPEGDPNCDNIVWGSSCPADNPTCDNIVWGSAAEGDNVLWSADLDTLAWGSECDTENCDNIVWGSSADGYVVPGVVGPDGSMVFDAANYATLSDGQLLRLMINMALQPAVSNSPAAPPPAPAPAAPTPPPALPPTPTVPGAGGI